ncbi:MAG: nucleoside triphosphate pyrophosphatase [Paracoccaceae bacterium]
MPSPIILASGSEIRHRLLIAANVKHTVTNARVDEAAIRTSMQQQRAKARDIADALAEAKARKVSSKTAGAIVIGADQVLELDRQIMVKPENKDQALDQLYALAGRTHKLFSAVVIYQDGYPKWRFVGAVSLTMHTSSDKYLSDYVERNWHSIQHSVGCYKLEEEGARLFSKVQGDFFTVLGLPMFELLSYLKETKELPG